MAVTKRQLTHLNKLSKAAKEAHHKYLDYLAKIRTSCGHPLVMSESWGEEDTLGNDRGSGTTQWKCICCGEVVGSASGSDAKRSDYANKHLAGRRVYVPGSITSSRHYGGESSVLRDMLMKAPRTEEEVREHLSSICVEHRWSLY